MKCERCKKELNMPLAEARIETINCEYWFCIDCQLDVEEVLSSMRDSSEVSK